MTRPELALPNLGCDVTCSYTIAGAASCRAKIKRAITLLAASVGLRGANIGFRT